MNRHEKPVIFITFGDGDFRYRRAAARLLNEAKSTGIYSAHHNLDLEWLRLQDKEISDFIRNRLSVGDIRGVGYWTWKSSLLIWAARRYPQSIIHYMDAGHVILPGQEARNQIKKWINEVEDKQSLAWQLPSHPENHWTKRETLSRVDPKGIYWETSQIEGGFLLLESTVALEFGTNLRRIELERDGFYLLDQQETKQLVEFKAHRHDQSVHSLLWKQSGLNFRLTETSYPGPCNAVVAARHASGYPWHVNHRRKPIESLEFYVGKAQKFIHMHPNALTRLLNRPLMRCKES